MDRAQHFAGPGLATADDCDDGDVYGLFITKREKAESEAQRDKPKGTLESEIRIAMLLLVQRPPRHAEL